MCFKENLEDIMESAGVGKTELSRLSGIHIKSIENYFREKPVIPNAKKAVKIAKVLGVTVEELVNGKKSNKNENMNALLENRDFSNTLSKLDKYNSEIITSVAKTLLNLQSRKKK